MEGYVKYIKNMCTAQVRKKYLFDRIKGQKDRKCP